MDDIMNHTIYMKVTTGNVGCGGIAEGKAKVIRYPSQIESIQKGDILITSHTTPQYVTVMKKVKAIVTDMGGITSHAAILSRELGIPCIIGAQNATKVIRSGEKVKVDAYTGVVYKIMEIDTYGLIDKILQETMQNMGEKAKWPAAVESKSNARFSRKLWWILNGINIEKHKKHIASQFRSIATLWKLLSFAIIGMRENPTFWEFEKRRRLVDSITGIMTEIPCEDAWHLDSDNKYRYDMEYIKRITQETPIIDKDTTQVLKATLWQYMESIYLYMHDLGTETRGPYLLNGKKYLIHDYYNTDLPEIWGGGYDRADTKEIRVISEYSNIRIMFDAFNNYYAKEGLHTPDNMWVTIDGNVADDSAVENLVKMYAQRTYKQSKIIECMSNKEKKLLLDKILDYALKPLQDMVDKRYIEQPIIENVYITGWPDRRDYYNISKELPLYRTASANDRNDLVKFLNKKLDKEAIRDMCKVLEKKWGVIYLVTYKREILGIAVMNYVNNKAVVQMIINKKYDNDTIRKRLEQLCSRKSMRDTNLKKLDKNRSNVKRQQKH